MSQNQKIWGKFENSTLSSRKGAKLATVLGARLSGEWTRDNSESGQLTVFVFPAFPVRSTRAIR